MCSSIGSGDSAVSSDSVLQSGHHTPRFGIIEDEPRDIYPPPRFQVSYNWFALPLATLEHVMSSTM